MSSYGGEDDGGIYHSIYDDFYWYTHFSDTSLRMGGRWRRQTGRWCCGWRRRMFLPFDFAALADTVHVYTDELKALVETRRTEAAERKAALECECVCADE